MRLRHCVDKLKACQLIESKEVAKMLATNISVKSKQTKCIATQMFIALLLLLCCAMIVPSNAAGVFELQVTQLTLANCFKPKQVSSMQATLKTNDKQFESRQTNASNATLKPNTASDNLNSNDQNNNNNNNNNQSNAIKVFVCLKEAFASNLNEPCTYGNASLTLDAEKFTTHLSASIGKQQVARFDDLQVNAAANQSSHKDSIKIGFTFRWTKSFTIIISAFEPFSHQTPVSQQHQILDLTLANFNQPKSNATYHLQRQLKKTARNKSNNASKFEQINGNSVELLDRFVATECDILPLLANQTASSQHAPSDTVWRQRVSRGVKLGLEYQFRVLCAQNYFGEGCTTFCRERNDQFGHYKCNASGAKLCLNGWQGDDCNIARCRNNCNLKHAQCNGRPNGCECRQGWSGELCDECVKYPSCKNGYCLKPWQCICNQNWGGVLCDLDLNYCGTHEPCKNNARCQNIAPAKFKCHCNAGFAGIDCSLRVGLLPINSSFLAQLSNQQQQMLPPILQLAAAQQQQQQHYSPTIVSTQSSNNSCAHNQCLNGGTCLGVESFGLERRQQHLQANQASNGKQNASQEISNHATQTIATHDSYQQSLAQQEGSLPLKRAHFKCQCASGWTGDICQWQESELLIKPLLLFDDNNNNSNNSVSISNRLSNQTSDNLSSFADTYNTEIESSFELAQSVTYNNNSSETEQRQTQFTTEPASDDKIEFVTSIMRSFGATSNQQIEFKHLISGVMLASALGVVFASLLLVWCCLVVIESNKLSLIQMRIVSSSNEQVSDDDNDHITDDGNDDANFKRAKHRQVTMTIRRMQERIRDSFRRSSFKIKPTTKLSIDNALKPPKYTEPANIAASQSNPIKPQSQQLSTTHFVTTRQCSNTANCNASNATTTAATKKFKTFI